MNTKFYAFNKEVIFILLTVLFSLLGYYFIAYQIPRTSFWFTFGIYSSLFAAYLILYSRSLSWQQIFGIGLIFRVIQLFSLPELSDDFYRFYWDGLQSAHGISPFAFLPSDITNPNLDPIYSKLNSQNYYSIYPGVNQIICYLGALLSHNLHQFVLILKTFMVIIECVSFYFLFQLIRLLKLKTNTLILYFLNPLIILEFTGNLHFEGYLSCVLIASFYFFKKNNHLASSISLGLAFAIKIMPLLFIPFYFITAKNHKWLYIFIPPLVFILTLIPFYHPDMFEHINSSIQLYFGKFEFNSSFNLLFQTLGLPKFLLKFFTIVGLGTTSWFLLKNKISLATGLVWFVTWYLLFSQSIHPWYVAGFLIISVIEQHRYMVLWSLLIFLTYITYQSTDYQQQLWVNVIEYTVVICFVCWERFTGPKRYNTL